MELTLDGTPDPVSIVDGEFHSQLAEQFAAFETIDEVVETLLANEGRTWTLTADCDERRGPHGHHHEPGHHHGDHEHGGTGRSP